MEVESCLPVLATSGSRGVWEAVKSVTLLPYRQLEVPWSFPVPFSITRHGTRNHRSKIVLPALVGSHLQVEGGVLFACHLSVPACFVSAWVKWKWKS